MSKIVVTIIVLLAIVALGYVFLVPGSLNTGKISEEVASGEAVLLDVRTLQELRLDGYAEGSVHFDLARLETGEMPELDRSTKIYAYCKGGTRAGKAEVILEENGFTDVVNIGGLVDWESAGGEVVRE